MHPLHRREFLQSILAASISAAPAPAKRSPRVIVLGAGLSGMVAALELRNAGCDVTILEATSRPGGRVHTLREPFSDGLYAEAGAGRIPSTHDLTLRYVKQFNLSLVPFYPTSGAEAYFIKGKRSLVDSAHPYLSLASLEEKYLGDAQREVGKISAKDWPTPAVLKAYGSVTIEKFLRAKGASDEQIEFLVSGYQPEAALDFLRDLASHQAPKLSKIVGGNDLLPRAFADRLSANIIYGAQVVRMQQNASESSVTFQQNGLTHSMHADYLISAIPFTVLRNIEVTPAFSDRKQQAIRSMTYGAVSRVYFQTRTRFWAKEGSTGFATVDRALELWNPTWNQRGTRGILMAYAYEHLAREIGAQTPDERVTKMLDYFDQVYPGAKENVEFGTSWVWDEQPFQKGAYCIYRPGQLDTMLQAAIMPENRILFAGEHCSSHPAWMQGALESGLRAAATLLESSRS